MNIQTTISHPAIEPTKIVNCPVIQFLLPGSSGTSTFIIGRLIEHNRAEYIVHCPVNFEIVPDGLVGFFEMMPLTEDNMITIQNPMAIGIPSKDLIQLYNDYVEKIHPIYIKSLLKMVEESHHIINEMSLEDTKIVTRNKADLDGGTKPIKGKKVTLN